MPNSYEAIADKKFVDAVGLTYFCRILNKYPDNAVLSAVIDAIQDTFDEFGNAKIFSGVCATGGSEAAKAVTCERFAAADLVAGAMVFVIFNNTNTCATLSSLTLNVNATGAKPIKYLSCGAVSNIPAANYFLAGQSYRFVYDGTNWVVEAVGPVVTDDDAGNVTIY